MITTLSYRTSFAPDLRLLALCLLACLLACLLPMIVAAVAPVLLALVAAALPALAKLAAGGVLIAVFAKVTRPR